MKTPEPHRVAPALFGAAAAAMFSWSLGAPVIAALPASLLGAILIWLLMTHRNEAAVAALPVRDDFAPVRTALTDFMRTIDDPLILVERQRITMGNEAALSLLGRHILGEDARLAIRHPAAAERLIGRNPADPDQPIQLVGLGDVERRWELVVHDLDGERRLARLSDRTSSYAAERMRVDFVANASHELRTPLATLLGFIETLQDGDTAEDKAVRSRFLGIMFTEARRMQRLVDDLISLSRIEADRFTTPDDAVPLATLLREVATAAEAGRDQNQHGRIEIAIAPDLQLRGDHVQLSQMLHNLVGNALKYGQTGTPVRVGADTTSDGMIRIMVTDEGEGIAPEHLPRLTERFYRVDPGRSRAMGGTGLGLAIVKHIVERHRGRLDIRSKLGVGTTITVLLPAAPKPLS